MESDGWRWAVVEDRVAIDNLPAVAARTPLEPYVELQQAVVPVEVLKNIFHKTCTCA